MNIVYEVHSGSPLHDLNYIQFGNLPNDPFLIRNVIVNIHSHADIGVSHQILDHLDIQICLRHTSTCGMPQDVSEIYGISSCFCLFLLMEPPFILPVAQ